MTSFREAAELEWEHFLPPAKPRIKTRHLPERTGMHEVTMETLQALEIVEENAERHADDFEKTLAVYRQDLVDELTRKAKQIGKLNKKATVAEVASLGKSELTPPEDHRKEYQNAVMMLTHSVGDTITLDFHTY